ncbi:MAG: oligosaccharide flippase family protein [Lactobacillales bacterium]|jgi:O-antigen/teichoic acid export membrane protein|nr:oligosaccharide flippase family protein [Lactobacillales bacterium]
MNKYKKLAKNSLVFAFGNMGSKFISFLLVPLYTYYLTSGDYGKVDIIITTISIAVPIVSLSVTEGVFRFSLDKENDNKGVLSTSIILAAIGCSIFAILSPILLSFGFMKNMYVYFAVILILQIFQGILAQFLRGIGKDKSYTMNSAVYAFAAAFLNILFLVYFHLGIKGYLLAQALSVLISIIFLFINGNVYQYIDFSLVNIPLVKKILTYSLPLIPTSVSWWFVTGASRYIILGFLGASANGLFAVATKIPAMLTMISNIFSQGWQMSAVEENGASDNSKFYSNVLDYYFGIMAIGASMLLIVLKPTMSFIVDNSYFDSWQLVPFLFIGAIFSSINAFFGSIYSVMKKTTGIFKTAAVSGIVSIVISFISIYLWGYIGAGLGQMFGWIVAAIYRMFDTRKYFKFEIHFLSYGISLLLILLQTSTLFFLTGVFLYLIQTVLFLFVLYVNKKLFLSLYKLIIHKAKRN